MHVNALVCHEQSTSDCVARERQDSVAQRERYGDDDNNDENAPKTCTCSRSVVVAVVMVRVVVR